MPSASKVMFRLETLREQALEAIDARIANETNRLAELKDDEGFSNQVEEWRNNQVARLRSLLDNLESTDNYALSRFQLDAIPKRDGWSVQRAQDNLLSLQSRRSKIIAKSEALVPDADGNIGLTKTQLAEFFDL